MRNQIFAATALLALLATLSLTARAEQDSAVTSAVCVVHPTEGNKCTGVVHFTQEGAKLKIVADIEGLTPNAKHAIHVHEYGDCTSKDGLSTGGHYNPEGHEHGLPEKAQRHAGDLGNLQAGPDGKAHLDLTVDNASLAGKNPILGRAIIVHAKADDGSQPAGNAGARIGCGVIGIAKPAK